MKPQLFSVLRRVLLLLCLAWCTAAQAATINGVWSYSPGGYLVLMEVQGGTVVALRVDPAMVSGEAFVGTRSGDAVQAQSLSRAKTLALSVNNSSYSGTMASSGSPTQSVTGNLLYAYAGSAYDGLWQRSGSDTRYQALVTFTADTVSTTLLLDASVSATTSLSYDIALGTISTARTPTFRGASLLGSRTLSLAFGSTTPLSATFTAQSTGLPPQTLEQFVVNQVLPIAKASQTLRFGSAPSLSVGGTATLSATASSGLPVSFSSLSTTVCTVAGSTVSGVTAGNCTVAANQAGNSVYEAAAQVTQTFVVTSAGRTGQTISFATVSGLLVGGTATLAASASSGLPVSYSSLSPEVCTASGSVVTGVAAGNCSVAANQTGNASYDAAPQVTQSASVSRVSQSISFPAVPSLNVGGTATLAASASSGLSVSYASLTPTLCTVSASTLTAVAVGNCTVTADQTGSTRYEAASQVTASVSIGQAQTPPTGLSVSKLSPQTVGSLTLYASTRLGVTWMAPTGGAVSAYKVVATDATGTSSQSLTTTASVTRAELSDLKAGTRYDITVTACNDNACASGRTSPAASGSTEEEYWQIQGSGNSYTTATKVVAAGTSLSWVMRWGDAAGTGLSGRYQYYYKNNVPGRTGIGIANTTGTGTDATTLSSFVEDTSAGLRNPCTSPDDPASCPNSALFINAVQALPMTNGKIRLFYEAENATETARPTRIYSIDSQDGLTGLDFNTKTTQAYCGGDGSNDYASGGACEPTVVFGLATDTGARRSVLTAARQFKIGYPTLTSWLWDGSAGSFMVVTGKDGCIGYDNALYYGVYDGSNWALDTDSSGCGKVLVANAHGPVLVHLGSARYKMYYEDESAGHSGKPLKLMYADGARSGIAGSVEFADWEPSTTARNVNFLWPDNTLLNAQEESGLGDHMVLMPSASTSLQYMYVNLGGFDNTSWARASAGLGLAKLLNP